MKSIIRFGIVAVVCALLISTFGIPVHAQGGAPNMCFDLKADDCQLVTDGFTALTKVTSTNFSWGITIKSDAPEGGNWDVQGKGSLVVPAAPAGGAPNAGNPLGAMMGTALTAQFQTTIDSKGKMGTQDLTGSFELRVTGGVLYIKSDKLTGGKWKGLKLDDLMTQGSAMMSGMTGMGGAGGAGGNNPAAGFMSDPALLGALLSAPNIPGVVKVTRDADQDATDKSEKYAQFTYNVDLVTLVNSKEFLPVIKALAAQAMASRAGGGAATQAAPPQLTDEQAAAFVKIIADALKDVKIQAVVAVGLDSKTVRGLGLTFNATLDPANTILAPMLASMNATKPVSFSLGVFVELSSVNKGDAITAPDGAEITTIQQLMQGMMAGAATPAK